MKSVRLIDFKFFLACQIVEFHYSAFKCTYQSCDKFFNRHDNLLQHLKVHKDLAASQDKDGSAQESSSHTPDLEVTSSKPPEVLPLTPTYNAFPMYYRSSATTINLAVSSLRTEIPHSPTEPGSPSHDTMSRSSHSRNNGDSSRLPRLTDETLLPRPIPPLFRPITQSPLLPHPTTKSPLLSRPTTQATSLPRLTAQPLLPADANRDDWRG
jgi:hypothetical protein